MKNEKDKEFHLLVWRVVALCASILALVCVLALAVLALFFPRPYAVVLQNVGLNQIALNVYEDIYANSKDVDDGYKFLTESIYAKNDKYIVIAFENVSQNPNFQNLLEKIDEQNQNKFGFTAEQSVLCNERDYLFGKYVFSLTKRQGVEKGVAVANADLNFIVQNLNSVTSDKSFILFDFVKAIETEEEAKLVTLETQQKILEFAEKCKHFAEQFLSMSSYSLTEYAESLESAIRNIESYVALKVLNEKNNLLVLSQNEIDVKIQEGNEFFNQIVQKVAKV